MRTIPSTPEQEGTQDVRRDLPSPLAFGLCVVQGHKFPKIFLSVFVCAHMWGRIRTLQGLLPKGMSAPIPGCRCWLPRFAMGSKFRSHLVHRALCLLEPPPPAPRFYSKLCTRIFFWFLTPQEIGFSFIIKWKQWSKLTTRNLFHLLNDEDSEIYSTSINNDLKKKIDKCARFGGFCL